MRDKHWKIPIRVIRSRMHISTSVCISWAAYWNEHPSVSLRSANEGCAGCFVFLWLWLLLLLPWHVPSMHPCFCNMVITAHRLWYARVPLSERRSGWCGGESAAAAVDNKQQGREEKGEGRKAICLTSTLKWRFSSDTTHGLQNRRCKQSAAA